MREWLYRASNTQAGADPTRNLAEQFGFICRSGYADAAKTQMIANVGAVTFGDVIHLYFVDEKGGQALGSYRVVGPNRHPEAAYFGPALPKTTLRKVHPGPLREALVDAGYAVDPKEGEFCGWPVVRDETPSPSFARKLFPGRNALVER